jgi:hypothetical protein
MRSNRSPHQFVFLVPIVGLALWADRERIRQAAKESSVF